MSNHTKTTVRDTVNTVYSDVTTLQREVVLARAGAPALIGIIVAFLASEGWIPTGLSGTITDILGWAFAVVVTVVGLIKARGKVTALNSPIAADGQPLVTVSEAIAAAGRPVEHSPVAQVTGLAAALPAPAPSVTPDMDPNVQALKDATAKLQGS